MILKKSRDVWRRNNNFLGNSVLVHWAKHFESVIGLALKVLIKWQKEMCHHRHHLCLGGLWNLPSGTVELQANRTQETHCGGERGLVTKQKPSWHCNKRGGFWALRCESNESSGPYLAKGEWYPWGYAPEPAETSGDGHVLQKNTLCTYMMVLQILGEP